MGDRLARVDIGRKGGLLCHFRRRAGAGSPSNTMLPGPRPTTVPSGILIHPTVWPQQTWAKNWGLCPFGRGLSPHLHNVARAQAYLHTMWHLDPSSRWASTDIGRKLWAAVPLFGEELGPHLTQCGRGRVLPRWQVSSWSIQPFGHNNQRYGQYRQTGQRSHSIGRTVVQTIAKNLPIAHVFCVVVVLFSMKFFLQTLNFFTTENCQCLAEVMF